MIQFNFDYRTGGDPRWEEFEVTREQLGPRLVALIKAAARSKRLQAPSGEPEQVAGRWLELVA